MPSKRQKWWKTAPQHQKISVGLVKIDRQGSTNEWKELPPEIVDERAINYLKAVEKIARRFQAAEPFNWQGDGLMLFLPDGEQNPAPVQACQAAKSIWKKIRVEMNLPIRIAVHWGYLTWQRDMGKLRDLSLDLCGHLEHVTPTNAISVSEDVYLSLSNEEKKNFAPLGITKRESICAYVYPESSAKNKADDQFIPGEDLKLWESFRQYSESAEIKKLRYVGFRLTKTRVPPTLDIMDVFVPLKLQRISRQSSRADALDELKAEKEKIKSEEIPFSRIEDEIMLKEPVSFINIFQKKRSLVVLGDPGAGKTTLIRWLAVIASGGPYRIYRHLNIHERLLPLPVSVGQLAELRRKTGEGTSVSDILAHYFSSRSVGDFNILSEFIRKRLDNGDCLVLLDGLDEVKSYERHAIRGWLESFAANNPKNRYVVTSRYVGYIGFSIPDDGQEMNAMPFDDTQVSEYVQAFSRAYYLWDTGKNESNEAEKEADKLLKTISESPRLNALARNPFLLSGLALIHRAEGKLPRHRVQFYEIFARCLCETWGAVRRLMASTGNCDISYEKEAIPIFGKLAIQMHKKYPGGIAPEEFVIKSLSKILGESISTVSIDEAKCAAEEFLERAGKEVQIFIERGPKEWGFLHLTFQEFFAAVGLLSQELFEKQAIENIFDPSWEEIIRLGVGYMALVQNRPVAAERFIKKVYKGVEWPEKPWVTRELSLQIPLAVLLVAEAGDVLPDEKLLNQITHIFTEWYLKFNIPLAHRILNEISLTECSEYITDNFIPLVKNRNLEISRRAALALGAIKSEKAVDSLLTALSDEDSGVRWRAASALGAIKSEKAVDSLLTALSDEDSDVRWRAAFALGAIKSEKAVDSLLTALGDKDSDMRRSAASALDEIKSERAVDSLLTALGDEDSIVRWRAASALIKLV